MALQVIRWSDGTYLEDQDFWRLSGIERDVRLYASPKNASIRDFTVQTNLNETYDSARLKLNVLLSNFSDIKSKGSVSFELMEKDETILKSTKVFNLNKLSQKSLESILMVDNVKLWSAEQPNLYTLLD